MQNIVHQKMGLATTIISYSFSNPKPHVSGTWKDMPDAVRKFPGAIEPGDGFFQDNIGLNYHQCTVFF